MVYTITFNPAIDYIMHIDKLQQGSIIKSQGETLCFGGKGINVSLILKELGVKSTALGFIAGFTGDALCEGISCEEITADFIRLEKGLTRINVKLRSDLETDINSTGPDINEKKIKELFAKLDAIKEGDILVLAGSIPNSLPKSIYQSILEALKDKNIKFVVDAEGELLLNCLKYKPFLIKPNREELEDIFNCKINCVDDVKDYAQKLQNMGAQNVLITLGGKGAVLLDQEGNYSHQKALGGRPINTVGAGDSTVAGFIAGYLEKGNFNYALTLAMAAGGATACSEGLATKADIEGLL